MNLFANHFFFLMKKPVYVGIKTVFEAHHSEKVYWNNKVVHICRYLFAIHNNIYYDRELLLMVISLLLFLLLLLLLQPILVEKRKEKGHINYYSLWYDVDVGDDATVGLLLLFCCGRNNIIIISVIYQTGTAHSLTQSHFYKHTHSYNMYVCIFYT